jgi:L-amino acid N-acyltransferase YncA
MNIAVKPVQIRESHPGDVPAIRAIYNEGIADRVATLDESPKSEADMAEWWAAHGGRYTALVAQRDDDVVGWTALNSYSHRCAHSGVADLSVYVARHARGTGVGTALLCSINDYARENGFHKIVLFALALNAVGLRLYAKLGYRNVGVFAEHGRLDGRFVDVIAMEKIV